jgi:hypothetical protein
MPKQPLSLQRMAVFSLLPPMVFASSIYLIQLAPLYDWPSGLGCGTDAVWTAAMRFFAARA